MNASDGLRSMGSASPLDSEGYDELDRTLRDSFPTSDPMSSTVVVGIGRPGNSDQPHAGSRVVESL